MPTHLSLKLPRQSAENVVQHVCDGGNLLAIIVRHDYRADGVQFLTPDDYSQQLAYMHHPKGKIIEAHVHNSVPREVTYTREVIFVRKGRIRVDFYSEDKAYIESRELGPGDVLLLAAGGHGFKVLEACEMIEVKQGPYSGEGDKTRFPGVSDTGVRLVSDDHQHP